MRAFLLTFGPWPLTPALLFFLFADFKDQFAIAISLPLLAAALGHFIRPQSSSAILFFQRFSGALLILQGLFFNEWLIVALSRWEFKAVFVLTLLCPFLFMTKNSTLKEASPFTKILFITLWLALLQVGGFGLGLLILGSCLLFPLRANLPSEAGKLTSASLRAFLLGGASVGLTLCIFKIIHLGIFPLGYEGAIYFLFIFGTGGWLAQKAQTPKVNTSMILLIFLLSLLFGRFYGSFNIDLLKVYLTLPLWLQSYELFAPVVILLLLSPLLFLYHPSEKHPSALTAGMTLFGLVQLFLLRDLDLYWQLLIFLNVGLLVVFTSASFGQKVTAAFVIVAAVFMLPHPLDEHVIVQGQRLRSATWYANAQRLTDDLKNYRPQTKDVSLLVRSFGSVGHIFNGFGRNFQGYGAFTTNMNDVADYQLAFAAQQQITTEPQNILILGLGNHIVLRELSSKVSHPESKIHVIDNFPPLFEKNFSKTLSALSGLSPSATAKTELKFEDAFKYLSQTPENTFDLIVWNLSWPNFSQSSLIYTADFGKLLVRTLKEHGSFVGFHFRNLPLDCTLLHGFRQVHQFPYTPKELYGAVIAFKNPTDQSFSLAKIFDPKSCESLSLNRAATSLRFRSMAWGQVPRIPQDLHWINNSAEHDPFSTLLLSRFSNLPSLFVFSTSEQKHRPLIKNLQERWEKMNRKDIFVLNSRINPWRKEELAAFKESYPHAILLNLDEKKFHSDRQGEKNCETQPDGEESLVSTALCLTAVSD